MEETEKDELGFYINFTRPLIFSLTEQKDRVNAASWVKKIKNDESSSDKLKTDYIKLLLFALQRRKLLGIFQEDPESYEKLPPFPLDYDLNLMAKGILEAEFKERKDRIRKQLKGDIGDSPPYVTDFSPNFKEFVAAQDIPGFGVHCFYALSKEPLSSWRKTDKIIPPKLAKSVVNTMTAVPEDVKAGVSTSCICPPKDSPEGEPSECKTRFKSPEEKKLKRKKYGTSPPSHPLGKPPPPDDRDKPQWGSNLTEVKERPLLSDKPTTSTGAIPKVKGQAIKIIYDEDSSIEEVEQALKDFRRGEVSGIFRKCKTIPKDESEDELPPEDIGSPYQSIAGSLMPRDDYEEWRQEHLDRSFWQEGVREDYPLVDYLKHTLARDEAKKHLVDLHKMAHSSEPARAGLPVTTPRLSPSPKRVQSSEKLYKDDDDDLPPLHQAEETQTKAATTEADENLYKLHEDMLAAVAEEDERIQREQMEIEMELERQEMERQEMERQEMEMQKKQQHENEKPEGQKKEVRIEPGSPAANRVFADYLHNVRQAAESRFESYEGVADNVDLFGELLPSIPYDGEQFIDEMIQGEQSKRFIRRVGDMVDQQQGPPISHPGGPIRKSGIPGPKTQTPQPRTGIPAPAQRSGLKAPRTGIPKQTGRSGIPVCPPPSGVPTARSGSGICRPPPGVSGRPTGIPTAGSESSAGICRPPPGIQKPPSGTSRPPVGMPRPSGIPQPPSGISRPPSKIVQRPKGLPQPGFSKTLQRGISPPQPPRQFKQPSPSSPVAPPNHLAEQHTCVCAEPSSPPRPHLALSPLDIEVDYDERLLMDGNSPQSPDSLYGWRTPEDIKTRERERRRAGAPQYELPPAPTPCPCHSPAHSLTPVFSPPLKLQPGDESFFSSPYTPNRRARDLLGSISPHPMPPPISSSEECHCGSSTVDYLTGIPEDNYPYSTYGHAAYSPALSDISGNDQLDDTSYPEGLFDDTPDMECECAIMEDQHSFRGLDDSIPTYLASPMMPQHVEHIHGTITMGSPLGEEGCPGIAPRRVASRTFTCREFITDNE